MHSGQLPVHSFQVHQQGSSGSINALADNIPWWVGVTDDRGDCISDDRYDSASVWWQCDSICDGMSV